MFSTTSTVARIPALLALLAALMAGCGTTKSYRGSTTVLSKASNAFAVDLYRKLRSDHPGKNIVVSPASIHIALSMTAAGARGQTAEEMWDVLHAESDQAALHASAEAQLRAWNEDADDVVLRVVNRLYGEQSFDFSASYLSLTRDRYGAPLEKVDFKRSSEAQRIAINAWVEEQTEQKIRDLLPPASLSTSTRLVLVNAVYFLGDWQYPFSEEYTSQGSFLLLSSDEVLVPMMHQKEMELLYRDEGSAQILELPYKGRGFSMTIILPRERDGLARLEEDVLEDGLDDWTAGAESTLMNVSLPKFRIETTLALSQMLVALGMPLAFDETRADFQGMLGPRGRRLFISNAYHKAFVDVNERGTEAAAATAIVMDVESAPPETTAFHADHPFLFVLRDTRSGAVLFMGRVVDPR